MTEIELSEQQWLRIVAQLPPLLQVRARSSPKSYRRFIEAVLQVVVAEMPWKQLKTKSGSWRTVYVRFIRWADDGIWDRVARALRPDLRLAVALELRVADHRRARLRRGARETRAHGDGRTAPQAPQPAPAIGEVQASHASELPSDDPIHRQNREFKGRHRSQ